MISVLSRISGLGFALGSVLTAAEFVVRDAQLEVSALPTNFDYTATGSAGEVTGTDAFASGTGLRGGIRWSWSAPGSSFGAIAGADLVTDGFTYAGGGGLVDYGARLSAGGGWAINDSWQVLAEAGYGYGLANLTLDQNSTLPAVSCAGHVATYDGKLITTYQAWSSLQLMLSAGWQHAQYDVSGSGLDLSLNRSGLTVGLGLTWRIDDSPPRVE